MYLRIKHAREIRNTIIHTMCAKSEGVANYECMASAHTLKNTYTQIEYYIQTIASYASSNHLSWPKHSALLTVRSFRIFAFPFYKIIFFRFPSYVHRVRVRKHFEWWFAQKKNHTYKMRDGDGKRKKEHTHKKMRRNDGHQHSHYT